MLYQQLVSRLYREPLPAVSKKNMKVWNPDGGSFFSGLKHTGAICHFSKVNTHISGDEIIRFNYVDVSIAVSVPKGMTQSGRK